MKARKTRAGIAVSSSRTSWPRCRNWVLVRKLPDKRANLAGALVALLRVMAYISDPLARRVIGFAINIHRQFGPGLYESPYATCFEAECDAAGLRYEREKQIDLQYRGRVLPCVYRLDFIIERRLLVELKAVERLAPVHGAQMLTYLKLSGLPQGLLINFNVTRLVDGVRSFVNGLSTTTNFEQASPNESEFFD
jgi:GxxExxY protein